MRFPPAHDAGVQERHRLIHPVRGMPQRSQANPVNRCQYQADGHRLECAQCLECLDWNSPTLFELRHSQFRAVLVQLPTQR